MDNVIYLDDWRQEHQPEPNNPPPHALPPGWDYYEPASVLRVTNALMSVSLTDKQFGFVRDMAAAALRTRDGDGLAMSLAQVRWLNGLLAKHAPAEPGTAC